MSSRNPTSPIFPSGGSISYFNICAHDSTSSSTSSMLIPTPPSSPAPHPTAPFPYTSLTIRARLDVLHACTVTLNRQRSRIIAAHTLSSTSTDFSRDVALLAAVQECQPIVNELNLVKHETQILEALGKTIQGLEEEKRNMEEENENLRQRNEQLERELVRKDEKIGEVMMVVEQALESLKDENRKEKDEVEGNNGGEKLRYPKRVAM